MLVCGLWRLGRTNVTSPQRRIQSLKLGSAAQLLPVIFGYGAQFVATPYVVSRLGLHAFGVWAITGAIAQYAGLLDLGLSQAANRYVAVFHAKGDSRGEGAVVGVCISALGTLGVLLCGLTLLTSNSLDRILGTRDPGLARTLLLCSVSILIVGLLARVLASASVGKGRMVPAGIGVAILSTLQALGGVAAIVMSPSLTAFALGTVMGTVLGLVAVLAVVLIDQRRIPIGKPNMPLARDMLSYGISMQFNAVGGLLLLQSGKLVAGIMIGPTAAGIYELASRLAGGAQAFGMASNSALIPHLTRSYIAEGIGAISSQYERLARRHTAVVIFVPLAMAATAFSLVPLWLGEANGQVIMVLLALLPGIAATVSVGVCTSTLMAVGRPAVIAYASVVGGVLQTAFAVALSYLFGLSGIAWAFAIGVPAVKLIGLWYLHTHLAIPLKLYIRGASGPFAVGVGATAIAFPIGIIAAPISRGAAVWPFLASALAFGATYALIGWRRDYLPQLPRGPRFSRPPA